MNVSQNLQEALEAREEFLTAMRNVANSVTVVTTNGSSGKHGATVSAFSSVSADPPTVLVCLNSASSILKHVTENTRFCVNVLPETEEYVASRFAGFHDDEFKDRFIGISHQNIDNQPPMLDGATAFHCDLDQTVVSGSHVICIGLVTATRPVAASPLIYLDRKYHKTGPLT